MPKPEQIRMTVECFIFGNGKFKSNRYSTPQIKMSKDPEIKFHFPGNLNTKRK
jgi:hypothetical protein